MTTINMANISTFISIILSILIGICILVDILDPIFYIVVIAIFIQNLLIVRKLHDIFMDQSMIFRKQNVEIFTNTIYNEFPKSHEILSRLRDIMVSDGIDPRSDMASSNFIESHDMNSLLKKEKKKMRKYMMKYMKSRIKSILVRNDVVDMDFDNRVFPINIAIMINMYENELIDRELTELKEKRDMIAQSLYELNLIHADIDSIIDLTE